MEAVKPRLTYAQFQAQRSLDWDALEFEVTPLLLDGEPVIYAGDHGQFVWLKRGNRVQRFRKSDVAGRLVNPNAKGIKPYPPKT